MTFPSSFPLFLSFSRPLSFAFLPPILSSVLLFPLGCATFSGLPVMAEPWPVPSPPLLPKLLVHGGSPPRRPSPGGRPRPTRPRAGRARARAESFRSAWVCVRRGDLRVDLVARGEVATGSSLALRDALAPVSQGRCRLNDERPCALPFGDRTERRGSKPSCFRSARCVAQRASWLLSP